MSSTSLRVLVAGATGLVGSELVRRLVDDPAVGEVRALVRRDVSLPSGAHAIVVDFDQLDAHPAAFEVDHVYCALGTTIKDAGSQEAFRQIDYALPLDIARRARRSGARHFLLVSAMGARSSSRIFYNRVKGELEDALLALDYPAVTVARPSLLLGDRMSTRAGEEFAKVFSRFFPARWRGVQAADVAESLVRAGIMDRPGVRTIENRDLHQ